MAQNQFNDKIHDIHIYMMHDTSNKTEFQKPNELLVDIIKD